MSGSAAAADPDQSNCVGELPPAIVGKDNLVDVLGRTSCSRKVTTDYS